MVVTAANTAQTTRCPECPRAMRIRFRMALGASRGFHRFQSGLRGSSVLFRFWECDDCGHTRDDGTQWAPPPREVRDEIVQAIRRLKASGWRLGEWDKGGS